MAEAFGVIKEGKIEQRELKLYIDNDSRLYRQRKPSQIFYKNVY